MTIQVEISAETEALLAAQAAARSMDVPSYAAALLEQAANPGTHEASDTSVHLARRQTPGKKSLAQLFAESPFHGLDVEFERDSDFGRDVAL